MIEKDEAGYITVRVRVRGLVQGVGFRYWALSRARSLSLSGYVRNLPDGSVEAALSGPEDAVDNMMELMRHGPPGASVHSVDILNEDPGEPIPGAFAILR